MYDALLRLADGLHSAAHASARSLTPAFREYAERHGAPADLVPHLSVSWDESSNRFELGVDDPAHHAAFLDAEDGGTDGRPLAFARGFERQADREAQRLFNAHLAVHL